MFALILEARKRVLSARLSSAHTNKRVKGLAPPDYNIPVVCNITKIDAILFT